MRTAYITIVIIYLLSIAKIYGTRNLTTTGQWLALLTMLMIGVIPYVNFLYLLFVFYIHIRKGSEEV